MFEIVRFLLLAVCVCVCVCVYVCVCLHVRELISLCIFSFLQLAFRCRTRKHTSWGPLEQLWDELLLAGIGTFVFSLYMIGMYVCMYDIAGF